MSFGMTFTEPRVVPLEEIEHSRSWAVYGKPGTGKTTFAGSFPKPILYLDVLDRGTRSLRGIKGVYVSQITHWDQFAFYYDTLNDDEPFFRIGDEVIFPKTVVVDTVTQAQLLAVNRILERLRKPQIVQIDWGSLTMQQWAAVGSQVKEMITLWRDLPLEVCFCAQERAFAFETEDDNETPKIKEIGPALTPAVATHLNGSVEIIVETFIRQASRKNGMEVNFIHSMKLGPHPLYITKVRKPMEITLPLEVDNPTHKIIVDIVEGRLE